MKPRIGLAGAALTAASGVILAASPAQYFGRQHDDIRYVLASHALSQGRYVMITSPTRLPLTDVIPGFPFLLLPVTWLAGDWLPAYQIFCALIMAAVPWLILAWLKPRLDPLPGLLVAILFATSPLVLSQAGVVMPEGIYTLFALWMALELQGRGDPRRIGACLAALLLIRPAALSLWPGALARVWKSRRLKGLGWIIAPPAFAFSAWSAWSLAKSKSVQEISELGLTYQGRSISYFLEVAWDNLVFYATSWGGCFLSPAWGDGALAATVGAALAALALAGVVRALRKEPFDPSAWMLVGGILMHGVWGWKYERYLLPLLPWLFWAVAKGLGRLAPHVLGILLACQLGFHTWRWFGESRWDEPELKATYAWMASRLGVADSFASPLFARDGYYVGRPSAPLPSASAAEIAGTLRKYGIRYVLFQKDLDLGLSLGRQAGLSVVLDRIERELGDSRHFRLIYANPSEGSRVYELNPTSYKSR